jgi:hypothetical protein
VAHVADLSWLDVLEDQGEVDPTPLEGLEAKELPPFFWPLYPRCSSFAWWQAAKCRVGEEVEGLTQAQRAELMHPTRHSTDNEIAFAKGLCASCEVQMECLDYAIEANETVGIWGGLGAKERRPLARARKVAKARLAGMVVVPSGRSEASP